MSGITSKRQRLVARADIARIVRAQLDASGFIEVHPPCLSSECIVDAHIDPIIVPGVAIGLPSGVAADRYYLQSSPELAMKRLLAEGSGSIYSLGPVFRGGERSPRHNPEFTMLEWYEVDADLDGAIARTATIVEQTLGRGRPSEVRYRDLFRQSLGFDPIGCDLHSLVTEVARVDEALAGSMANDRDAMLDVLMTERIEPLLAGSLVVVRNYPVTQAALARVAEDDPQTAERFELMVDGLELANGYGELLDADEFALRMTQSNRHRLRMRRVPLETPAQLVEAMRNGLPRCAGVAMGFDRLVMLATGTSEVGDVLTFPIESA